MFIIFYWYLLEPVYISDYKHKIKSICKLTKFFDYSLLNSLVSMRFPKLKLGIFFITGM